MYDRRGTGAYSSISIWRATATVAGTHGGPVRAPRQDAGALAGSRADERQKMLSLRSWALSGRLAALAAFIGLAVAIAVKASWWWPFAVILAVIGPSYLLGLSSLGFGRQDPADSDDELASWVEIGTGYARSLPPK